MNIKSLVPAVVLAASLCSAAQLLKKTSVYRSRKFPRPSNCAPDPAVEQVPGLTRKQVYDQLVQAETDGSLARLNATLYKGGA